MEKIIILKQMKNREFNEDLKCQLCGQFEQETSFMDRKLCSNCYDAAMIFELRKNYRVIEPLEIAT